MRVTKRTMVPLRQSVTLARKRPDRAWAVYFPAGEGVSSSKKVARRFFRLKSEAEAFCVVKKAEVATLGAQANALTDEFKREALACGKMLAPFGATLTEAVTLFIKEARSRESSVTVSHALAALGQRLSLDGHSARHARSVREVVGSFAKAKGDQVVSLVKAQDIQGWLDDYRTKDSRPLSPVSFNTYRRYISLFFNFCLKRGWVAKNPVELISSHRVVQKVPRLLSPDSLKQILQATPERAKSIVWLQAHCGLRTSEASRARWSDFLQSGEGYYIQIGSANTKTARRRLTPVPKALADYLCSVRKPDGFIYAEGGGRESVLQNEFKVIKAAAKGVMWHRNALRASALSYRLALTKDAAATAFEMGNSACVLMRDYRELTTPVVAEQWFSVRV